jgi:acyl-CoA thioesterase-1
MMLTRIYNPAIALLLLLSGAISGCGQQATDSTAENPTSLPSTTVPEAPPGATAALRLVFLGDSLTAGYSLPEELAFPALLGTALQKRGYSVEVINAGVSGDTSAGGLRRLDWLLQQQPAVVVVGLGGNDGLRGLPLEATESNLRGILERSRQAGARILLLGMRIPPNYGADYAEGFAALYPRLADEMRVRLVPFLLEGVGGYPELNLPDGIHPNAEGHQRVAENVLPHLEGILQELSL